MNNFRVDIYIKQIWNSRLVFGLWQKYTWLPRPSPVTMSNDLWCVSKMELHAPISDWESRVFMLFPFPFVGGTLLFSEPSVDYESRFDNIKVNNLLVQTNFHSTYLVMFQFGPRAFQTSFSLRDKQFSSNSRAWDESKGVTTPPALGGLQWTRTATTQKAGIASIA